MLTNKTIRYGVLVGFITIFASTSGSMLGLADDVVRPEIRWLVFRWLAEVSLIAAIGLVIVLMIDAINRYAEERNKYNETALHDRSREAVSRYVHVRKRSDHLIVEDSGDATLTWEFEVENVDSRVGLDLQVHAEHPAWTPSAGSPTAPESNVEVVHLSIAGQLSEEPGSVYSMKEFRHPWPGPDGKASNPMEFGVIRIPITHVNARNQKMIGISMQTKFKGGAFRNAPSRDYFVVEIPQLTDVLRVKIEPKSPGLRAILLPHSQMASGRHVVAQMGYAGTEDTAESDKQSREIVQKGRCLIWEVEYPKVGYQYCIFFKTVPIAQPASLARRSGP